jgi:hypothetical protein
MNWRLRPWTRPDRRPPHLQEIRDKAEALGRYTEQRQYSLEIQNTAAENRLEAERRMGELGYTPQPCRNYR